MPAACARPSGPAVRGPQRGTSTVRRAALATTGGNTVPTVDAAAASAKEGMGQRATGEQQRRGRSSTRLAEKAGEDGDSRPCGSLY